MNSSGIKRGLAVSAISALAITGAPFLASSASAATGDVIQVGYSGPARNAGSTGAEVVLNTKGIVPGDLKLTNTALAGTGTQNTPSQTVTILSRTLVLSGAQGDATPNDGLDQITLRVQVTTPTDGATASYAVYEDETGNAGNNLVDAAEARAQVTTTTAGAPTAIQITPASQTAPVGQTSGDYTVTLKDAGGRTTQLTGNETLGVTSSPAANTTINNDTIDATETSRGTATFTASGSTTGLRTLTVAGTNGVANTVRGTATLDVVGAATISAGEFDIVTGADSFSGYNDTESTTSVRVDQSTIRIDFKSNDVQADANGTVVLNLTGSGGITFGGKTTAQVTTTLNSQGTGSVTITPDAGTINENGSIAISGLRSGNNPTVQTINYDRSDVNAAGAAITSTQDTYLSAFGGTVTVTIKVTDQFGLPVTSGLVDARRDGGANSETTYQAKKALNSDGTATFTFTDTKATATSAAKDDVIARYFVDQFAANPTLGPTDVADIVYSANGQGSDLTVTADNVNPAGASYTPAAVSINPLADAVANSYNAGNTALSGDEYVDLNIAGGTQGVPVTITVDNGALVLNNTKGETTLAQGAASKTGTLTDDFRIVGTKDGLVTVTVASGGVTKTFQFTVKGQGPARNITLTAPDSAEPGSIATFVLKVSDAFGNGISGDTSFVNVTVTGPGALQDQEAVADANGERDLNVRIAPDADGAVTVTATGPAGFGSQFGAQANRLTTSSTTDDAPGLTASVNSATASVDAESANLADPTIATSPSGNVPVGTAVTATVTVKDTNGDPVQGAQVQFLRSGAGDATSGSSITAADGTATYSYTSNAAGTVTIQADVTNTAGERKSVSTTTTFTDGGGNNPGPVVAVNARITGNNNGPSADRLNITVNRAQANGARVQVYKLAAKRGGKPVLVRSGVIQNRRLNVVISDRNKNGVTKYYAIVRATSDSKQDRTNTINVK